MSADEAGTGRIRVRDSISLEIPPPELLAGLRIADHRAASREHSAVREDRRSRRCGSVLDQPLAVFVEPLQTAAATESDDVACLRRNGAFSATRVTQVGPPADGAIHPKRGSRVRHCAATHDEFGPDTVDLDAPSEERLNGPLTLSETGLRLFDDVAEPEREWLPLAANRLREQGGAFKPHEAIAEEDAVSGRVVGNRHPPQYPKLEVRDDDLPMASEDELVMDPLDWLVVLESDRGIRAFRDAGAILVDELRRSIGRADDRA